MRDSDVGEITWFHPEEFGVSVFMKWLKGIAKKKGKVFDPPSTSSESEQDQERSGKIKFNEVAVVKVY